MILNLFLIFLKCEQVLWLVQVHLLNSSFWMQFTNSNACFYGKASACNQAISFHCTSWSSNEHECKKFSCVFLHIDSHYKRPLYRLCFAILLKTLWIEMGKFAQWCYHIRYNGRKLSICDKQFNKILDCIKMDNGPADNTAKWQQTQVQNWKNPKYEWEIVPVICSIL